MIRTMVVDDDFRVAHIHAERVARVPGFECVGEAYTAADAREKIERLKPELLLLDVYLPDESGISLMKWLHTIDEPPDCILITAARDLETVRSAMRGGAFYYLVKPFGFDQFARELEAYRVWREQTVTDGAADQASIDELFALQRATRSDDAFRGKLPPTMNKVLASVRESAHPIGAAAVAEALGMSRPTAQRYLSELERRGLIELHLEYGSTGRPTNTYRPRR
jgi:response regulator of citrate/malate metabolism